MECWDKEERWPRYGSQFPDVSITPRTVNLKYKENDKLLSCYLQRTTYFMTNNSMPIFVFFFGCNKCRGHIALTIITCCYKCQIGQDMKRNSRNLAVNRVWYLVTKFHQNKPSVGNIFVQNLSEPAAYFVRIWKYSEDMYSSCTRSIVYRLLCRNLLVGPNRTPSLNNTSHSRVHALSYPHEGIYYLQANCVTVA